MVGKWLCSIRNSRRGVFVADTGGSVAALGIVGEWFYSIRNGGVVVMWHNSG